MNYNLLARCVIMAGAALLDLIFGDPVYPFHPIRLIGGLITLLEKLLRKLFRLPEPKSTGKLQGVHAQQTSAGAEGITGALTEASLKGRSHESGRTNEVTVTDPEAQKLQRHGRTAGICLVVLVLVISVGIPALLIRAASLFSTYLGVLLSIVFGWQLLALRSLCTEADAVRKKLPERGISAAVTPGLNRHQTEEQKLREAGRQLSRIVGRDTDQLDEQGIIRAAIETVAENVSDGVIAPLFYMALFGIEGAFFYKAVNTLDSMVGYKNERYRDFGRAAAKLDDLLNLIPARLSAAVMIAAAAALHLTDAVYRPGRGFQILMRDGRKHESPNAGICEAASAGILGIRLNGPMYYGGILYEKPWIGDPVRRTVPRDITRMLRLASGAAGLAFAVFLMGLLAAALF